MIIPSSSAFASNINAFGMGEDDLTESLGNSLNAVFTVVVIILVGLVISKKPFGLKFLGRDDEGTAEASTWYQRDGGTRIIYTPDETHPQNTWSLETGKNTIEFFEAAFEYQLGLHADLGDLESYDIDINKNGQVWWLKEAFTMVALVALFLVIFPAFMILT
jgi:hypothetical protein